MSLEANKSTVVNGKAVLGIELGSTRTSMYNSR